MARAWSLGLGSGPLPSPAHIHTALSPPRARARLLLGARYPARESRPRSATATRCRVVTRRALPLHTGREQPHTWYTHTRTTRSTRRRHTQHDVYESRITKHDTHRQEVRHSPEQQQHRAHNTHPDSSKAACRRLALADAASCGRLNTNSASRVASEHTR